MTNQPELFLTGLRNSFRLSVFALSLLCALTMIEPELAQGQTYTLLHNFTAGSDGANPNAGLTGDGHGNFYGTTTGNVTHGYGTIFKLSHEGPGWVLTTLYTFQSGGDGAYPAGKLIFGPDGAIYGTTLFGGGGPCRAGNGMFGCGTVFRVTPGSGVCRSTSCPWTETVLYRFGNSAGDATNPVSAVTFDSSGNIYGTTDAGGAFGHGTVYELMKSGGTWNESLIYSFSPGPGGENVQSEVIFDAAGNLYGTAPQGGQGCMGLGCGVVYKLSRSGSGWTEAVLYVFQDGDDGADPYGGLIFDSAGNLYGTTVYGGAHNPGGTVFELSPSNGGWTFTTLYSLYGDSGPSATLTMDSAGNLYGTASGDPNRPGSIFELVNLAGGWSYSLLHAFDGLDGYLPAGSVARDASGNLYGVTANGGTSQNCMNGCGVVWEITP
jgi:uncharacterized repeat protein (TIGR03803 family)